MRLTVYVFQNILGRRFGWCFVWKRSMRVSMGSPKQWPKMGKTLGQKLSELSEERQRRVVARSSQLQAEERTLQGLRKAHRMTQSAIAKKLGIGQEGGLASGAAQ